MRTQEKIQQLERDVATLWQIVEDERLWHPSVIREIRQRAQTARRAYVRKQLKTAEEVLALRNH